MFQRMQMVKLQAIAMENQLVSILSQYQLHSHTLKKITKKTLNYKEIRFQSPKTSSIREQGKNILNLCKNKSNQYQSKITLKSNVLVIQKHEIETKLVISCYITQTLKSQDLHTVIT